MAGTVSRSLGPGVGREVLQLGGNDPAQLALAVRLALPFGYDEINLNCGCPAIESGGGDFGASLMRDPDATARIVDAMVWWCKTTPIETLVDSGRLQRLKVQHVTPLSSFAYIFNLYLYTLAASFSLSWPLVP